MSVASVLALVSGLVGVSGIATTILNFDPDSPWYGVGLLALGLAAVSGLTAYVVSHRSRIIEAFDVGYQAGYRKGRYKLVRPKVIRLRDRASR